MQTGVIVTREPCCVAFTQSGFEGESTLRYAYRKATGQWLMLNLKIMAVLSALTLSACMPFNRAPQFTPDGQPIPTAYTISPREGAAIPGRIAEQINMLRANSAMGPLMISQPLNAAAVAHARDMSAQNRAWHFGSDGSSPLDRVQRAGYLGKLVGENISETYENEIATLAAWMQDRETRDVIMDPTATQFGIGWLQEPGGKVWWVLITGT